MPGYFFNFEDASCASPDLVGRDLPDDEAAKAEARKLAADLGFDHAIEGSRRVINGSRSLTRLNGRSSLLVSAALREPNRML